MLINIKSHCVKRYIRLLSPANDMIFYLLHSISIQMWENAAVRHENIDSALDIVIQINEQLNKQTFLMHNEVKPDLDQVT